MGGDDKVAVIKVVKRKRSKSHSALLTLVQGVLAELRENQYTAIAIAMKGKKQNYLVNFILDGTDIDAVAGMVDDLKDEVKKMRYEQED